MVSKQYPTGVRPGVRGGIEIRWQINGKSFYEFINKAPTQAHIKAAALQRKKRINELRLAQQYGLSNYGNRASHQYTFFEVANLFIGDLIENDSVTFSTRKSYMSILNAHWFPVLEHMLIEVIDYNILNRVFSTSCNRSKKTRKNILVPLSRVFEFALTELRCIEYDPSNLLRVKAGQKPPIDPFTLEEQEAILSAMPERSKLFYLIAFDTGMRLPSEILALKWTDYDGQMLSVTKGRVICRETKSTKTNKARFVQLTQRVIAALEKAKAVSNSEWIFSNANGTPMLKDRQQKIDWKMVLGKLSIRYRRPYTCRHTRASLALKAGVPPRWLAQQLGHSVVVLETTYAKWINEESDKRYVTMIENYREERTSKLAGTRVCNETVSDSESSQKKVG